MLIPILLLITLVGLLYFYMTKSFGYWKQRNIEGPEPSLFVGNFKSNYNKKIHLVDEVDSIYKKYKGKTSHVGIFNGVRPSYFVFDPEIIKKVLISNFASFNMQGFFPEFDETHDPLMGRNPFFLKGEAWKEKRNEITPAFSTGRIKALFPIMTEVSNRMKTYLLDHTNEAVETRELCGKFTTDVVAASIFGMEGGSFSKNQDSEIRKLVRDVMSPSWRLIAIVSVYPAFPIIAKMMKLRFIAEDKAAFLVNILNQTLQYRKENNVERQDYVDYLIHLRDKKGLLDVEVAAHTVTFFFDGIETSSITMSYIFYELAKNQRAQDKLREMLLEIKQKGPFTYESVYDNKYLDQIVYETMRLHSVAPLLMKRCTEDITLTSSEGESIKFEKGISVSFPVRNLHLDPEYWDKPDEFIPERFDDDKGGMKVYREKGVFMPFGDGPRICLGQRFALAQLKCGIANIVSQFKVTVSDKMPEKPVYNPMEMMLVYKSGILLNYEPLEN